MLKWVALIMVLNNVSKFMKARSLYNWICEDKNIMFMSSYSVTFTMTCIAVPSIETGTA